MEAWLPLPSSLDWSGDEEEEKCSSPLHLWSGDGGEEKIPLSRGASGWRWTNCQKDLQLHIALDVLVYFKFYFIFKFFNLQIQKNSMWLQSNRQVEITGFNGEISPSFLGHTKSLMWRAEFLQYHKNQIPVENIMFQGTLDLSVFCLMLLEIQSVMFVLKKVTLAQSRMRSSQILLTREQSLRECSKVS